VVLTRIARRIYQWWVCRSYENEARAEVELHRAGEPHTCAYDEPDPLRPPWFPQQPRELEAWAWARAWRRYVRRPPRAFDDWFAERTLDSVRRARKRAEEEES
jgi:hypothetical protein